MPKLIEVIAGAKSITINGLVAEEHLFSEDELETVEEGMIRLRYPIYGDNPDYFMIFADQDVEVDDNGIVQAECTMLPTGDVSTLLNITIHI